MHRPSQLVRWHRLALLMACALGVTGCGKDDLRAVNAITDAEPMKVTVTGNGAVINHIAFGDAGSAGKIADGSYRVLVSTSHSTLGKVSLTADPVPIVRDHLTTLYALGRIAAGSQTTLLLDDAKANVPGGQTEVRFVHAAAAQGALDIYVTAPGAALATQTPRATLVFGGSTAAARSASGTFEIRITPAGDATKVLYDSGSTGVAFDGGASEQIALLDHTGIGVASALFLLVLPREGTAFSIQHGDF